MMGQTLEKLFRCVTRWAGLIEEQHHHFYRRTLNRDSFVLDLGCNKGDFSRSVAGQFGCKILGVEASPTLFRALPVIENVRFLHYAVSDAPGEALFHLSENPYSSSLNAKLAEVNRRLDSVQVKTITLRMLLEQIKGERLALLKVDIEGAELAMFNSASDDELRGFEQITVEFHDLDMPECVPQAQAIQHRLEQIGFFTLQMSQPHYDDVLFINLKRLRVRKRDWPPLYLLKYIVLPLRACRRKRLRFNQTRANSI